MTQPVRQLRRTRRKRRLVFLSVAAALALLPMGALPAQPRSRADGGPQRAQVQVEETPGAEDDGTSRPLVIEDDFEDETKGVFSTASSDPELVRYAYDDGEFVIETLKDDAGVWQTQLNGPYADVEIAVDVRVEGRTRDRFVKIGCRFARIDDGFQEYSFVVDPNARRVLVYRSDGGQVVPIFDQKGFAAVNPEGASNHLELRCVGATISASVNGTSVASVEDGTYAAGAIYLGAGTYSGVSGTVESRWDDLHVNDLARHDAAAQGGAGDEGAAGLDDERSGRNGGEANAPRGDDAGDELDSPVVREEFDDEEHGLIRPTEDDIARYGYDDGEFVIEWVTDAAGSSVVAFFPFAGDPPGDVVVAVEVRLAGETNGRAVTLGCRERAAADGLLAAYRVVLEPDARRLALVRVEGDGLVVLEEESRVAAVNRGDELNRLALSCVGDKIEASVNGEVVLSAKDVAYDQGAISLGIAIDNNTPGPAEAHWDNLEVKLVA